MLVTGAAGLLGTEVVAVAPGRGHAVIGLGRVRLDVTDREAVDATLEREAPDVVIHCAAYTSVDGAEDEPELALSVNQNATKNVANAALGVGARFVYISTDYVFDGTKGSPYGPGDAPSPLSTYGRTKLAGEIAAAEVTADALIVRTSWLYGSARRNFVTSMIARAARGEALTVVDDQFGGPSWARHVADAVVGLVERGAQGVWHVADRGACSWADLAREAIRLRKLEVEVAGVSSVEWGAKATRPRYSVLDVSATEAFLGREMADWRDALARFISGRIEKGVEA